MLAQGFNIVMLWNVRNISLIRLSSRTTHVFFEFISKYVRITNGTNLVKSTFGNWLIFFVWHCSLIATLIWYVFIMINTIFMLVGFIKSDICHKFEKAKMEKPTLISQKKRGIQAVCGHWPRYHELRCMWRGVSPRTAKLHGVAKQFLVERSRNL